MRVSEVEGLIVLGMGEFSINPGLFNGRLETVVLVSFNGALAVFCILNSPEEPDDPDLGTSVAGLTGEMGFLPESISLIVFLSWSSILCSLAAISIEV